MKKKSKVNNLKFFIKYYKPYKWIIVFDLVCACLTTVCELVLPMLVRFITKAVGEGTLVLETVLKIGFVYLFLKVVDTLANYYTANTGHVMGAKIETDMRRDLFSHL